MPRKKPKITELPTDEAIKKLFPKRVIEYAKALSSGEKPVSTRRIPTS